MSFYRIYYRIPRIPGEIKSALTRAWGRARRGWSPTDVWSFDWYLAKVIGEGLIHLSETTHSYPGREPYEEFEKWQADLRFHGERLIKYAVDTDISLEGDRGTFDDAVESMHWVADNFGSLWD